MTSLEHHPGPVPGPDRISGRRFADGTLADLFRRQMRATPFATAIVTGGTRLSYADLARQVDILAGLLRKAGADAGGIVAVALPHSAEQIAVLLAVIETGAAYLPVDVSYPAERIRHMLSHARPRCVVAGTQLAGVLDAVRPDPPVRRVHVADLMAQVAARTAASSAAAGTPASARPRPADTAYVIYTSGSTGRPKGVAVSHASVVSNLRWVQRRYPLRARDRVLHKTPLGFDVSVWEMCWPLVTGATLVIADPAIHMEPAALAELMRRERVTVAHFVPSMLDVFLDTASLADCDTLRMVILSGEAVSARLCRKFLAVSAATLHNLYGPTEATIHVTSWDCARPMAAQTVPIGQPADNTQMHVLNERLRPVAAGERGDLYIGGAQVATGYLNNPALTAASFVACPYGPPGERMYRTGDLARWNPGGDLEYLGRSDSQVKINGVRIEIAEVEAALERHPAVRQAAVVPAETSTGQRYLSALVTLDSAAAPGADRLLRLLDLPPASRPEIMELAAGLPVCVPDRSTGRYAFQEVFEEQAYTPAGIALPDGACVLDIGAGVGIFTLYVGLRVTGARVIAAEPAPERFEALRNNVNLHAIDAVLLPYAVGENAHEAFGPHEAPVRTISQILDEEQIDRVALLKIDAGRGGHDVLASIEDRHWPRVDQVCLKVRDRDGGPGLIEAKLAGRGFAVHAWRPSADAATYLYAQRAGTGSIDTCAPRAGVSVRPLVSLPALADEIRAEAGALLAPTMLPATVTAVAWLPLTPNGKLDRERVKALTSGAAPVPGEAPSPGEAPLSEREQILCELIAKVVGVPAIGVHDNLFRSGGTSLSAVKLTAAISKRFSVSFRLRMVVENPTAARLARKLDEMLAGPDPTAAIPSGTEQRSENPWRPPSTPASAAR